METVKNKWLWGIFISILCIFAMSHNASAKMVLNYEYYDLVQTSSTPNVNCDLKDGTSVVNWNACSFGDTTNEIKLQDVYTNGVFNNLKVGDIIQYYIYLGNNQNYAISGGLPTLNLANGKDNLLTIDVEQIDDYHSIILNDSQATDGGLSSVWNTDKFAKVYKITQRVPYDGNFHIGLDTVSGSSALYLFSWYQNTGFSVYVKIFNIVIYRPTESKENKEVEEKTQDAVDQSEAAGGSSSSDAQTGTTGLLNAITGAVNVISSARPTNCKINGNMGNLDIGQLDLCANPAPAFIQTIGSLILILMCVPLAISLFNRFISIFRSFQS